MTTTQIIMISIWSIVLISTLLIEILTVNFISIWFSVGSLVSIFISVFEKNYWVSIIVFPLVSLFFISICFPIYMKYKKNFSKIDINSLVGIKSILLKDSNEYKLGEIKIGNTIYQTKSETLIKKDTLVQVKAIQGNKLLIEEVSE